MAARQRLPGLDQGLRQRERGRNKGMAGGSASKFERINLITGGDPAMIREMLDLFLRLAPEFLERMKVHLEVHAWEALAREAHKFKPSTLYIGLGAVYQQLELVEQRARNNPDAETLWRLVDDIGAECASAFPELQLLKEGLA